MIRSYKEWYRDAMAEYAKSLSALNPGKLTMGNIISWVNPSSWIGEILQSLHKKPIIKKFSRFIGHFST